MKVTVITGSPHKKGTSALLADEFIRGAQEAGWETFRFDAAFEQVAPCLGCDRCGIGAAPCVQKDGMPCCGSPSRILWAAMAAGCSAPTIR